MTNVPIIERKVNVPWKNALKSNFLTKANAFLAVKKTFLRGNSSSSTFCIFSSFYTFSTGASAAFTVSVINIRYIIFQNINNFYYIPCQILNSINIFQYQNLNKISIIIFRLYFFLIFCILEQPCPKHHSNLRFIDLCSYKGRILWYKARALKILLLSSKLLKLLAYFIENFLSSQRCALFH